MLIIFLIYALFLICFYIFSALGIYHLHKNGSVFDFAGQETIGLYKKASLTIIILTILAFILEIIFIPQ